MDERLFPGASADLAGMPVDLVTEVSAMASLASLGLDWILADPARFAQFVRETAELHDTDPAECLSYEEARHLADHAEGAANRIAHFANTVRAREERANGN